MGCCNSDSLLNFLACVAFKASIAYMHSGTPPCPLPAVAASNSSTGCSMLHPTDGPILLVTHVRRNMCTWGRLHIDIFAQQHYELSLAPLWVAQLFS
jgi:hypothetical protein